MDPLTTRLCSTCLIMGWSLVADGLSSWILVATGRWSHVLVNTVQTILHTSSEFVKKHESTAMCSSVIRF